MADLGLQSDPVFIDVASGSGQYPILVTSQASTSSVPLNNIVDNSTSDIKIEPICKMEERPTSPSAPFVEIQPRRIRCTECTKYTAENEEKMLRHVRKVHRGENPFQCYMCDYSTYNKSLFEEHVRIHQGIKPFKCSHCSYRSASKKNTKKHELIHRPDNPHKCQQCGFIARHLRSLQCHMNSEHKNTEIGENGEKIPAKLLTLCQYCNKKVEDVVSHEKTRKKCSDCDMIFCNRYLLKKHVDMEHSDRNRYSKIDFECVICKWSSNIKPKILLHLIHHPNQPVDESVIDLRVLKECGIVGQGW